MPRPLLPVPASDVPAVLAALRGALDADGPAVLPQAVPGPLPAGLEAVDPGVALVIETSGSTGVPKRVALSRDALLAHAAASASALRSRPDARALTPDAASQWLLCLPAHYVAGAQVLVRSIVAGTEPVVMPEGHFDAASFAAAASRMTGEERFTSLVPVQLARLVEAAEAIEAIEAAQTVEAAVDAVAALPALLRRFDGVLVGGQALRPELRERALALGIRVVRTYGSSETSGGCVYDGRPIGRVRARLVGGLLELSGPTLAEGYLGDPARTAAAFAVDAEGVRWYRTGDLGEIAADGRVSVLGRADNVIVSGGEKVLLDLVERHVRSLPGFAEAVVVAADDPEWGQTPVVVVARSSPAQPTRNVPAPSRSVPSVLETVPGAPESIPPGHGPDPLPAVRASVAAALGRAAQPARIVTVAEIPLLASGKPDRVALRALAAGIRHMPTQA